MARVFYVHWNKAEALERVKAIRGWGHSVAYESADGAAACKKIKRVGYDVVVVDLRRLPSHGRRVGEFLGESKATRDVPTVYVDGEPDKVATVKAAAPAATFTTFKRLKAALARAL